MGKAGVDGASDAVAVFSVTENVMQTLGSMNNAAPRGNELEPVAGE